MVHHIITMGEDTTTADTIETDTTTIVDAASIMVITIIGDTDTIEGDATAQRWGAMDTIPAEASTTDIVTPAEEAVRITGDLTAAQAIEVDAATNPGAIQGVGS